MNYGEDKKMVENALGDAEEFKIIFDRYKNLVNFIIKRMMGNAREVDDLFQDAFILIWKSLKKFRGECSLTTYINKIVVNMCLNKIKKQEFEIVELKENITANSDDLINSHELKRSIKYVLNSLRPDYRALLILREVQGLSYEEIAKILNCRVGKVKVNLHRARCMFKEKYKEEIKNESR